MRALRLRFNVTHTKFCIVGGGAGGVNVSSHLAKFYNPKDIRVFEREEVHYYQPGYTMIGGDLCDSSKVIYQNSKLLNKEINWTQENVRLIKPEQNLIITLSGEEFTYEQLIMASGVKLDWDKIKGAREALEDPESHVSSIYQYESAEKTRKLGKSFKGGVAIFTEPEHPIKCAGAPQKILYLLTKQWQDRKLKFQSHFFKPAGVIFGVPKYAKELTKIAGSYNIGLHFKRNLLEINKDTKTAHFKNMDSGEIEVKNYDFLHIVPAQSPHTFIAESGIGNAAGYVDVDKFTLRHTKYSNIWAVGDCSSTPNSKTAAAMYSQTEILIKNLASALKGEHLSKEYNGYSCCPIFVGGNKLMLAEFLYEEKPTVFAEMVRLQIPKRKFYLLKKYFFPYAYSQIVPTGSWGGRKGIAKDW